MLVDTDLFDDEHLDARIAADDATAFDDGVETEVEPELAWAISAVLPRLLDGFYLVCYR